MRVVRITHKAKDPPVISALHNNNDSRDNSSYILGGKSVSRGPGKQSREQSTYVCVCVSARVLTREKLLPSMREVGEGKEREREGEILLSFLK